MSDPVRHFSFAELEAQVEAIRQAPRDVGQLDMIVRRPVSGEREILAAARLSAEEGLIGDRWSTGSEPRRAEQLTVMSSRAIAAFAGQRERWPLAGDQLYVDFDLSAANAPPGTRLAIGTAIIEVSAEPHTGCKKFRARYGLDASRFVGSEIGKALQLRGINAMVVVSGEVWLGDVVRKL